MQMASPDVSVLGIKSRTLPSLHALLTPTSTTPYHSVLSPALHKHTRVAMLSSVLALPLLAGAALASPLSRREMHAYTQDIEVHESCNSTQRRMLNDALA